VREVYKYNFVNVRYGNEKDANSFGKTAKGECQVDERTTEGGVEEDIKKKLRLLRTHCQK